MRAPSRVLFLDTGSPVSSIALGGHGEVLSQRTIEQRRTSELLLASIEELLAEAGVDLADLYGIAALQGPGSFTGLRIGLATALGLHQATGLRATALPTLPILALAAGPGDTEVLAAVDAMRGDWVTQRFTLDPRRGLLRPVARSEPELLAAESLGDLGPCRIVGFGAAILAGEPWFPDAAIELLEPPPLAATAARWLAADRIAWRADRLSAPIYYRPPAVTVPKR